MDAQRYLEEIVAPTIADYAENIGSVRHGFLACVATFHTLDYLAMGKKKSELRRELREASSSYHMIDRIAHAFKHVMVGNLRSADLIGRPPADWLKLRLRGTGIELGEQVLAGTEVDLLNELNSTLEFLRAMAGAQVEITPQP